MSKFKVGDKVVRTVGSYGDTIKGGVYTVSKVIDLYDFELDGLHGVYSCSSFKLAEGNYEVKQKRQLLLDAINVVVDHKISIRPVIELDDVVNDLGSYLNVINYFYPLESPEQEEVRKIKEEMDRLVERLEKLQGEL